MPSDGTFDGYEIKVVYGGEGAPDGEGHGHVVSNDGVNIHYWREPHASIPIIDDRASTRQLSEHGLS